MTKQLLFHEVVEAHSRTVLAVCASVLGPGPDAEDAWQETFVSALGAFPFEGVANVEAWLVRVAQRRCVDVLRRRRRDHALADGDILALLDREHAPAADEVAVIDEIWQHVAQLTVRQRFVVAHRYVAQWTYPEIADALGCSPAAARRCGSDAIAALRDHMTSTPALKEQP